jgi:hypothetical protein
MGHLLKIKYVDSRVNVNILASTSVPFRPTMVQVPNLALTRHDMDNSAVSSAQGPYVITAQDSKVRSLLDSHVITAQDPQLALLHKTIMG